MKILKGISSFKNQQQYEKYVDSILCGLNHPHLSRIEHIIAVYLAGRNLIKKVFGFRQVELNTGNCVSFDYFWMFLSLFHDVGYDVKYQSASNLNIYNSNKVDLDYLASIFNANDKHNKRWTSKYSKEEILFYYDYWLYKGREYGIKEGWSDGYEIFEHGILGGHIFSTSFHNSVPGSFKLSLDDWNDFVLGVSFTIAIHNIWPITSEYFELPAIKPTVDNYEDTKVHADSFKKGGIPFSYKTDLLAFAIYLIDTIDIVKKFYGERDKDGYERICDFELLNNVLKKLDYKVKKRKKDTVIIIKYGNAKTCFEKCERMDIFNDWIGAVESANKFLDLRTKNYKSQISIIIPTNS